MQRLVVGFAAGAMTVVALYVLTPIDDTDAGMWRRSGVTLVVDYATGCHYLKTWGGVTPRLDRDGKHVCAQRN